MDEDIDTESADAAILQLFAKDVKTKRLDEHDKDGSSSPNQLDIDEQDGVESDKLSTSKRYRSSIICLAQGCRSRASDLAKWRAALCIHGAPRGDCNDCRRLQPYRLHHVDRSSRHFSMLFAALLMPKYAFKRICDRKNFPSVHWRVCSDHFHESQKNNPKAFPILGLGKTHAEIRRIAKEYRVERELPNNFESLSLKSKRLTPCFSLPRGTAFKSATERAISTWKGVKRKSAIEEWNASEGKIAKDEEYEEEESSENENSATEESHASRSKARKSKSQDSAAAAKKRRFRSVSPSRFTKNGNKKTIQIPKRFPAQLGVPCAVSDCDAHVGLIGIVNRPLRFFGIPGNTESAARWIFACKKDLGSRQYWNRRIACMISSDKVPFRGQTNFLVCEQHFVDGRPTGHNPFPTLLIPQHEGLNETGKAKCIIPGCGMEWGMRNPRSKTNIRCEFYPLPEYKYERVRWLASIRSEIHSFPSPPSNVKVFVCQRHFSSTKFDIPLRQLVAGDDSSSSEFSEAVVPEEPADFQCEVFASGDQTKYRTAMSALLQRRPMFKCLVRCCPVTNHMVKNDYIRPYMFFDLPTVPTVRSKWLDSMYVCDSRFEFPPPLIGCGKYAVCERHFTVCLWRGHCRVFNKLPLTIIPTVNLVPEDASNIDKQTQAVVQISLKNATPRYSTTNQDQQLKRDMKAMMQRWCCREVPQLHLLIVRLSFKVDRLYELIQRLCVLYNVKCPPLPEFDIVEDDRLYGHGCSSYSSENEALEKALEGLMEIAKNVQPEEDWGDDLQPAQKSEGKMDLTKENEDEQMDMETRISDDSADERGVDSDEKLEQCDEMHGSGSEVTDEDESGLIEMMDKLVDDEFLNDDEKGAKEENEESGGSPQMPSGGEGHDLRDERGDISDDDHSACDNLDEPGCAEENGAESPDGQGNNEIAPPLSPHVEDGPPLLFTEADQLP